MILKLIFIILLFHNKILCNEVSKEADNELFKKLRSFISLIDQLRDNGVNEYIKLPRICSLGTQSTGKSSIIESIVGLDFLPRGEGVVTRRPLELRLFHIDSGKPWAKFEEKNERNYTNFTEVKSTIQELTNEVCKGDKNIEDKPIILNIYSKTCPDLTIIDLPGITKVPVGDQPNNIEEITKNMAKKYIDDPLTIILCAISANSDIATSDGLKLAKEIDKEGTRTLGVLTKIDIMDEGTDIKKILENKEIELKLGYVGVINRSKKDLDCKLSMEESLNKEEKFFKNHKIYKNMDTYYFGTKQLINRLSKIYFRIIKESLPKIINSINDRIKTINEELEELGKPIPSDNSNKISILINMINEYCEIFKNVLRGKYNEKMLFLEGEGGFKIRKYFTRDYDAVSNYTDKYINNIININEGYSLKGFPNIEVFYYLIRPLIEKLKNPIYFCFENVFQYLTFLSRKILEKEFANFPTLLDNISDLVDNFLIEKKNKTKYLIESIVNMENSYFFTNDEEYVKNHNNIKNNNDYIDTIKSRINTYFNIVVKELRNCIPKIIGSFLMKEIEDNLQIILQNKIYSSNEIVNLFIESESLLQRRKELTDIINIMKSAQNIIWNNPDFGIEF